MLGRGITIPAVLFRVLFIVAVLRFIILSGAVVASQRLLQLRMDWSACMVAYLFAAMVAGHSMYTSRNAARDFLVFLVGP